SKHWAEENPLNAMLRAIGIRNLKKAHAVRLVSEEQKLRLVQELGLAADRLTVIPVSVSFEPSKLDRNTCKANLSPSLSGSKVVLFGGRLVPMKNLALWVDVAKEVLARNPDTRFLVAGDGSQVSEVKSRVCATGLGEAFVFLGPVPYRELPQVYGAADIFL